jgi:hypothetical protein
MRNQMNKTYKQRKEYSKLLGFNRIKNKYNECNNKLDKTNLKGVNTEFINYNKKVKKDYGIKLTNINYYERKWIQEVNEIKKKIK